MNLFHESKKVLDKDGKVNPLGPYGKMKLTGQEVANYFRKNKVSDPKVKKAVEVALDMAGAYDVAGREIQKFYGRAIRNSKEVNYALKYANEETVLEGMKMKDLMRKHKRELTKAYKTGDLSFMSSAGRKAEDDLMQWAMDNGEVNTDDPDDFFDWLSRDLEDIVKGKIKESIQENYRVLAKHGMGAETKNSIKVGTEVDYYQKDGAKYMGKITKMTSKGYIVRDDKTKKDHEFTYHDRTKAKKLLKQGDNLGEGKGTDIFKKYNKIIGRLSDKEQDEILNALYTLNTQSGGKTKEAHGKVKELLNLDYTPEGDNIQEKVEYVEYKFRNKRDAQKALDYFKSQQLIQLELNDDGLSQGELAVDAGKYDMTKYHKEVMKKFKPKVLTQEAVSVAQQAAIAIDRKEKRSKGAYKNVMDSYRQMWQDEVDTIDEGKYTKYSDLLVQKSRLVAQGPIATKEITAINKKIAAEMKKLGVKEETISEAVADLTVDIRNKIPKPADQNKHAMEIAKQAKRFGLKSSLMGKHVRLKGGKKAVNDFLRVVIGKSSYGDPTEKDTSTPQIDKMLNKGLK